MTLYYQMALMLIGGMLILIGINGHIYYAYKRNWPLNIIAVFIGALIFIVGLTLVG